ncbi:hypothetical protein J2X31_000867 [Flavobacterium arsenatis]|uniref:UspA domain-containing protein n=1 Tax=Flavobacterium arsenatis TaxID=1484332 RepID=A0ABU1TM22_9FLAO|nr:hypothetical protein [Flavobacterium arsenatis]MDR6966867.1 hypothetical protein [Flavobacterium arsenatis]
MKNLLIPTTLEADTINAVKTAIRQSKDEKCTILLMIVADVPDTESASFFLRTIKSEMRASQKNVLNQIRTIIKENENCTLKIHNQYGISSPLIKNLIEFHNICLTIVTPSYKASVKKIQQQCLQLLCNCKSPILHLTENCEEYDLSKALYIETIKSRFHAEDVQQLIQNDFDCKIVSQAKLLESQVPEDMTAMLSEAISKNQISLLIETRKPEKISFKKKHKKAINELLGLPVLSVYEELV